MNYWKILDQIEDRYAVTYIWKILEGVAQNLGIEGNTIRRTERHLKVPKFREFSSKNQDVIYCNKLSFMEPKLFDSLPMALRDLQAVEVDGFKKNIDAQLSMISEAATSLQESTM